MNEMIFKTMIEKYERLAFTDQYIFGFADRGVIYMAFATAETLPYVCCLDKVASNRKGGYSIRFKPNKAQKEILKAKAEVLCSQSYFESLFEESKYNRGEIFEKLITEKFGQVWVKDTVPFTKDGDLTIDNVAYQIKFQKATFCTESQLARL